VIVRELPHQILAQLRPQGSAKTFGHAFQNDERLNGSKISTRCMADLP
jgi:hypothetical protein